LPSDIIALKGKIISQNSEGGGKYLLRVQFTQVEEVAQRHLDRFLFEQQVLQRRLR